MTTLPMADSWYRKPSPRLCINIDISPEMAVQSVQRNQTFVSPHLIGPQLHQLDLVSK